MYTCVRCAELFWDQLYGLLEEERSSELRAHLAGCSSCQAELAQCTAQQKLVARAARLHDKVPPFTPPAEEISSESFTQGAPGSAILPLSVEPRHRMRRWPWLAAAAAVLLLVGGLAWYQNALTEVEGSRRQALAAVQENGETSATEANEARRKLAELPRALGSRSVRLSVLGSAILQNGAPSIYRVKARDQNDAPPRVPVTARVVAVSSREPRRRQVVSEKKLAGDGEYLFYLPPDLKIPADHAAFLEVEAGGSRSLGVVSEKLSVALPSYRTQLAIDRAVYRIGEIVYFRSLTLNPFTQTPPEKPLSLITSVTDSRGTKKALKYSKTQANGVSGGTCVLTDNLAEGICTLETTEALGRFPPVVRSFQLTKDQAPQLEKNLIFDRDAYKPGDEVNANFQARRRNDGAAAADKPVTATVNVNGKPAAAPAAAGRTNAQGEAYFRLKLPSVIPSGKADLEIKVEDGKRSEKLIQSIPVTTSPQKGIGKTSDLTKTTGERVPGEIELFPEGGSLVAGLPCRVYFRARSFLGSPVDLEGAIVDSKGKKVAKVMSMGQDGLGFFSFTPTPDEKYSLQITSPANAMFNAPFPEIQKSGVVLAVPAGVTREGEPLTVELGQNRQNNYPLIVAVSSRGHIVDQQLVPSVRGASRVELTPPAGVNGVIRITVYESRDNRLVPLAERLAYRLPARRLDVAAQLDKSAFKAGDRVTLSIPTRDEKSQAAQAFLFASVVDESALKSEAAWSKAAPTSGFYLASELTRPEDLDEMDIWTSGDAPALRSLDRFLATQGWRRFGPAPARIAPTDALVKREVDAWQLRATGAASALLSLDNGAQAEQQYHAELSSARKLLKIHARIRADELDREKSRLTAAMLLVEHELSDFRDLPRRALGYFFVILVGILFFLGCVALLIGAARAIRSSRATTPFFATAFASLLLCLAALVVARQQSVNPGGDADDGLPRVSARSPWSGLDTPASALGKVRSQREPSLPGGLYAPLQLQKAKADENVRNDSARYAMAKMSERRNEMDRAGSYGGYANPESRASARGTGLGGVPKRSLRPLVRPQPMSGAAGLRKGKASMPAPTRTSAKEAKKESPIAGKDKTFAFGGGEVESVLVQYAHIRTPGAPRPDLQETLLWAPDLKASQGNAKAIFDLSDRITRYRVLILGHTSDGRQGMARTTIDARPPPPSAPSATLSPAGKK